MIFTISSDQDKQDLIYYIQNMNVGCTVEIKKNTRTQPQNKSIHLYAKMLAEKLNDAGLDKQAVYGKMKSGYSVPWTMQAVKEDLWHPIQKAMFNVASTAKLDTKQVGEVYQALDRWTAESLGVTLPFPSR